MATKKTDSKSKSASKEKTKSRVLIVDDDAEIITAIRYGL